MGALYFVLFTLATGLQLTVAESICNSTMCGDGSAVYCTNETINLQTILFPVATTNRIRIVYLMNQIRNTTACGETQGAGGNLPPSSNMVYAQWDQTAQAQAVATVQNCAHENSLCNGTDDKQLVYYEVQPAATYNAAVVVEHAFAEWYSKCISLKPENVANYSPNPDTYDCARLIVDRGQWFACALAVKQINSSVSGLLFVCSFRDCLAPNCTLYTEATVPRLGCGKFSRSHSCLCAVGEQYNYDVCPTPNFCDQIAHNLCGNKTHVACMNSSSTGCLSSENLGSTEQKCNCTEDAMTQDVINNTLAEINDLRNKIALGYQTEHETNETPLLASTHSAEMSWSTDLQRTATRYAKMCPTATDQCHSTYIFPNSGQTIYHAKPNEKCPNVTALIKEAIKSWGSGMKYVTPGQISSYPQDDKKVKGSLLIAKQDNVRIGCGVCRNSENTTCIVVCNYATSNTEGCSVYDTGSGAASECRNVSLNYPNLCNTNEYNITNVSTRYNYTTCNN